MAEAAKRGARKRGSARSAGTGGGREAPRAMNVPRPVIEIEPEELTSFNESINILVHGNSGVGKTALAGSAPHAVFLSTEKGAIAAQRTGSQAKLIRAYDWQRVHAALDWADENLGGDDWLILDSVTKMQMLLIRWILATIHEENEARDEDIPAIQDHQKWQNMFMRFIDRIVDAKYNAIFIATSMHKEDPDGESLVLPSITGKDYAISNYVCAQMDAVYYYGVAPQRGNEPTVRRILTETFPPYFAKDRFGIFERWIDVEDGTYDTMAWLIEQIGSQEAEG